MTMDEDPWSQISAPSTTGSVSARRVDPGHPFNFFWGLDVQGRPLLALETGVVSGDEPKLPSIRGLDISVFAEADKKHRSLFIVLRETENKELFYRLCVDVVDATRALSDEGAALNVVIRRVWRWQKFLKGGKSGRLSVAEEKGLIGEIWFLEQVLFKNLKDLNRAVRAWQGPELEPKDFVLGVVGVETKARNASGRPMVEITSGHQLEIGTLDSLFLYTVELERSSSEHDDKSYTLDSLVERVRSTAESFGPNAIELLDIRLAQAGYFPEDGYSENRWITTGTRIYHVAGDFPRIVQSDLLDGVSDVRYKLDLNACKEYQVGQEELIGLIRD